MNIVKEIDPKSVINENLEEIDIFSFYLGKIKLGEAFNSVLRQDNSPSCCIYQNEGGHLRYKDYSTGQNLGVIHFVMELFHLTYNQAIKKIVFDFGLSNISQNANRIVKENKTKIVESKKPKIIQIIPKNFSFEDLNYFLSFGIDIATLKKFNVYSVEKLWINKKSVSIKPGELCFAFYYKATNHLKIYFPLRPKGGFKWFSNINNLTDIMGYEQANIKVNKPKLLVLTSSLKEIMLLDKYNIPALAIHSENSHYHPDFIRHIKKYAGKIFSLEDFDPAGQRAAENLLKEYDIPSIPKPEYLEFKDISDCYKNQGREVIDKFAEEIKLLQYDND